MNELETDFDQMFADIDRLLESDDMLALEQEEEEKSAQLHTDNANRIKDERERNATTIKTLRSVKIYQKLTADLMLRASESESKIDTVAESLVSYNKSGELSTGAYETIVKQLGIQEEEPEEAPPILQEQAEVETIGGVETLAVGSG